MNCGNCRLTDATREHVRACYEGRYTGQSTPTVNAKTRYTEVEVLQHCEAQRSWACEGDRHVDVRVTTELAERYYEAMRQTEVQWANGTDIDAWNAVRQEILDIAYSWTCEPCQDEAKHDRQVRETTKGVAGDQLVERAHTEVNRHTAILNKLAATTDDEGNWTPKRPWDAWSTTSPKMAEAFEGLVDMEMAHETGESDFEEFTDSTWYIEDPRVTTAAMTALALHDCEAYADAEAAHWEAFTTRVSRKRQPWEYGLDLLCGYGCGETNRVCAGRCETLHQYELVMVAVGKACALA